MTPATEPANRVVIVDDTADLRDLLSLAMARGGFDVIAEAGDGQEAIEVVRRHRPDIILLDLAMPVMDGLEALPSLRQLCPTAKIVVLSGFGTSQMSARAMAAGADGYVQKGASLNSILDYVRDLTGALSRPPRALSIVPPRAPDLGPAKARPEIPARASSWEALSLAPYGVLELADESLFRIVHANPMARRLLGHAADAGTPLARVSPTLASLTSYHLLDSDGSFEIEIGGDHLRASLRRTGWSVLVYLQSRSDDVGLLRRAIATTAHEIRGPVAVINGIAETLGSATDDMDAAQRGRLMASVVRQARMLDSITADLLTTAQIQRGTLRINLQSVDPRALVQHLVTDRYDVSVVVEDRRPVRADPLRLEQMLSNLLDNAHQYGRAPYSIRVRPAGSHLAIDVVDEGDGVPADFRDQLFREYARAAGTVSPGTGLGLYVVRTLAEAQGGTAGFAPRAGGGSIFTITLDAG